MLPRCCVVARLPVFRLPVSRLIAPRLAVGDRDRLLRLRLYIRDTLHREAQHWLAIERVEHTPRDFIGDLRCTASLGRVANYYLQARLAQMHAALRLRRPQHDTEFALQTPQLPVHPHASTRRHPRH